MRALLAACLIAATTDAVMARDILANGDFSQGSAHWSGDRSTNTDASSLTITLKRDGWAKVFQTISTADTALKLHVTYQLSADCTFLPQNGKSTFFITDGVVKEITGLRLLDVGSTPIPIGGFLGVIVDPTKRLVSSSILDGKISTDSQTSPGFFYNVNPHQEKTFYLAFPPGNGTVTISGITLEPAPQGPTL